MAESGYASSTVVKSSSAKSSIILEEKKVYTILKRGMDVIGATLGLICLSWLFLIVAILIKLEDPTGTVFLSKYESVRMVKSFICISSDRWFLMLKSN
jgi:lipopolysaccharide/colanic/teichoic acid biosynthesis glycosyltransferase